MVTIAVCTAVLVLYLVLGILLIRKAVLACGEYFQAQHSYHNLVISDILDYCTSIAIITGNRVQNRMIATERTVTNLARVASQVPQQEALLVELPLNEPQFAADEFQEAITELVLKEKRVAIYAGSSLVWFLLLVTVVNVVVQAIR
jgi:hypothetical protein